MHRSAEGLPSCRPRSQLSLEASWEMTGWTEEPGACQEAETVQRASSPWGKLVLEEPLVTSQQLRTPKSSEVQRAPPIPAPHTPPQQYPCLRSNRKARVTISHGFQEKTSLTISEARGEPRSLFFPVVHTPWWFFKSPSLVGERCGKYYLI